MKEGHRAPNLPGFPKCKGLSLRLVQPWHCELRAARAAPLRASWPDFYINYGLTSKKVRATDCQVFLGEVWRSDRTPGHQDYPSDYRSFGHDKRHPQGEEPSDTCPPAC